MIFGWKTPLWYLYITWAMFILGLFSSWGTLRICPAWSPTEHQLTPTLSPIWGPRPKPHRPEEVVYIPNDSYSHFTQRLFPPKLPWQHTCTVPHYTFNLIHTYYTSHSNKQLLFFIYMTNPLFHFFGSSYQAGCPWSLVSDTCISAVISKKTECLLI
jgi:hypothetical protein